MLTALEAERPSDVKLLINVLKNGMGSKPDTAAGETSKPTKWDERTPKPCPDCGKVVLVQGMHARYCKGKKTTKK